MFARHWKNTPQFFFLIHCIIQRNIKGMFLKISESELCQIVERPINSECIIQTGIEMPRGVMQASGPQGQRKSLRSTKYQRIQTVPILDARPEVNMR